VPLPSALVPCVFIYLVLLKKNNKIFIFSINRKIKLNKNARVATQGKPILILNERDKIKTKADLPLVGAIDYNFD
jgi:hypothetical protein